MILRLILCFTPIITIALCSPKSDWNLHKASGKEFLVVKGLYVNHDEAKLLCETQYSLAFNDNRTSLATIKSWDEQRFVYALALRASAQQMGPIHFWIGARKVGNSTVWLDDSGYQTHFQDDTADEEKLQDMFDSKCFDNCLESNALCGRLDLSRFVTRSGTVSVTNPWLFFECGYFTGFICQHRRKVNNNQ